MNGSPHTRIGSGKKSKLPISKSVTNSNLANSLKQDG
jgi:hypothetical protein